MRSSTRNVVLLGATWFVVASCVTEIAAVSGGTDGEGAVMVATASNGGSVGVTTTSGSGGAFDDGPCGLFEDLVACVVDDTTADTVDQTTASAALVGTWRRCNPSVPGAFDVGVRFQDDGRVYRLYRRPNDIGPGPSHLVYCGSDMSDGGTWEIADKGDEGLPDEYDLTIAWDDGDQLVFDVFFYQGVTNLGLDLVGEIELFAPEGPPYR